MISLTAAIPQVAETVKNKEGDLLRASLQLLLKTAIYILKIQESRLGFQWYLLAPENNFLWDS